MPVCGNTSIFRLRGTGLIRKIRPSTRRCRPRRPIRPSTCKPGHVRNTGIELSLGYDNQWRDFRWTTDFTYSWNKNEIRELAANAVNPVTGESLNLTKLDIKGLGKAKYILKRGGTLGDLYTTSNLRYNENGYVEVDNAGNWVTDEGEDIYLGSVFPDANLAWRNDFSWKGINLGVLFTARLGGVCYSATQANLDLYGVSGFGAAR